MLCVCLKPADIVKQSSVYRELPNRQDLLREIMFKYMPREYMYVQWSIGSDKKSGYYHDWILPWGWLVIRMTWAGKWWHDDDIIMMSSMLVITIMVAHQAKWCYPHWLPKLSLLRTSLVSSVRALGWSQLLTKAVMRLLVKLTGNNMQQGGTQIQTTDLFGTIN